jgi:hypothetical protein
MSTDGLSVTPSDPRIYTNYQPSPVFIHLRNFEVLLNLRNVPIVLKARQKSIRKLTLAMTTHKNLALCHTECGIVMFRDQDLGIRGLDE